MVALLHLLRSPFGPGRVKTRGTLLRMRFAIRHVLALSFLLSIPPQK